jgi:putative ABC transport system substrate-binding protein
MRVVCAVAAAIVGLNAVAVDAIAQAPIGSPRIGYLGTVNVPGWFEAFLRGLRDLGYVEGRTIIVERRSAAGHVARLPDLATELVGLEPRVIVASAPPAVRAAKNATARIPIVMAFSNDPIALGLVDSLARPRGNVTGLANMASELMGKRLELLAEIIPGLSRVGVIWDPDHESSQINHRELQAAVATLRLALESFEVTRPEDLDGAFRAAAARTDGVIVLNTSVTVLHREATVAAAARHKVRAIYFLSSFIAAGGLIAYGADFHDLHRRAAVYVDKILKGASPANLPVEQPTKFTLTVNLKAAKALGITIPRSILVRSDDVIE